MTVLAKRPYREMAQTLREFEGWRSLWWRLPLSALALAAVPVFAVSAGVLVAVIGAGDFLLGKAVVAAVVATGATAYVQPRLAKRELHRRLIADRLWTWEAPNPATHVQIFLRESQHRDAIRVLRRAGFNPSVYAANLGQSLPDAPDLDLRMGVEQPEAHPQSSSNADRERRIADALDAAGIRARVGGLDVPRRAALDRAPTLGAAHDGLAYSASVVRRGAG